MEQTEKADILDNQIFKKNQKKLWSIRLLIAGTILIAITFLIATFWESIGLSRNETIWLALSMMLAFGINVAGIIFGFIELKRNFKKALIGIIGNFLFILLFVLVVLYSLAVAP